MKIAIYARVSTKDKGQDVANQINELQAFVGRNPGWEITHEYIDNVSASGKKIRPQFVQMFEDASTKQFDMVLFWSLDRFSREGVLETLKALQRLDEYGVQWFSYKEEFLRSVGIFRDAVLAILATIAKQERLRISERVMAGLARARREGKVLGPPRKAVRAEYVYQLHDEQKLSLRQIAKSVGCHHMVIHRILRERST